MSSYREGQVHQLMAAFEKRGEFSSDDIARLGQFADLRGIRSLIRDEAIIIVANREWQEKMALFTSQ